MTPTDPDAYVGLPTMFMPKYDEIHISCCFTWDIKRVKQIASEWNMFGRVYLGGPAFNDKGEDFIGGRYLKSGITITSRGCPTVVLSVSSPKEKVS